MTVYEGGDAFDALYGEMQHGDVKLVPLSEKHLLAFDRAFHEDTDLWEWLLIAQPRSQSETTEWFARTLLSRSNRTSAPFAIELTSGEIVGTTAFRQIRPEHGGVEIGSTMIFAPYRRTRVNSACKLMMLRRAFDSDFVRVELITDTRNTRSRNAIERLGASLEGVLRSYQRRHDGTMRDTAVYSIAADEWPRIRTRLEAI